MPTNYISKELEENIMTKKREISVETKSQKEMLDEMFLSAHHYLNRAIPEISSLAGRCYQSQAEGVWDTLLQMLDGIQWLLEFMNHITNSQDLYSNWHELAEIAASLQNQLVNLEEALKYQDMTLIGDILNYEIIPILESGNEEIQSTIDKEVNNHGLN